LTNDERDRLLTRLETLIVEVLKPKMEDLSKRVRDLEKVQERRFGGDSWRGAVIRVTLVVIGLLIPLTLGILALIYR
jgi:hypothetical protein